MANDKKFKKGPRTTAVGCTQASVSANSKAGLDVNTGTTFVISAIEELSTICMEQAVRRFVIGDDGPTKAKTLTPASSAKTTSLCRDLILLIFFEILC